MNRNPAVEDVELSLIQADVDDIVHALLAYRGQDSAGVLAMLTFPIAGLVAEESYRYFCRRRRQARLGSLDGDLFAIYGHSLTKVRARLKLFDDTDAGPANLVSFLNLVRQQSRVLFSHPSSRVVQWLSGPFRPDLGAFFMDDVMVATTHAALPAMGFSVESLQEATPGQFSHINSFSLRFAQAMGAHFRRLASVLESQGCPVNLEPESSGLGVSFTHNDFVARRFYRHAEHAIPSIAREHVPALMLCLVQVNVALHVLPLLMGSTSGLLARAQYLSAYHASRALRGATRTPPKWLQTGPDDIFSSRSLRNLFAHYELRSAGTAAIGSREPLSSAVESIARQPMKTVLQLAQERLSRISEFLGHSLTKSSLQPSRALLGDHS